jgi:hypothetical protein
LAGSRCGLENIAAQLRRARADGERKGEEEGRKRGLAEGRRKGLVDGAKKGFADGFAEGLAEGERNALAAAKDSSYADTLKEGERRGLAQALWLLLEVFGDPIPGTATRVGKASALRLRSALREVVRGRPMEEVLELLEPLPAPAPEPTEDGADAGA